MKKTEQVQRTDLSDAQYDAVDKLFELIKKLKTRGAMRSAA